MATEVVGRFVHTNALASAATVAAARNDESATVRKKDAWYAPVGSIHRRIRPREARAALG